MSLQYFIEFVEKISYSPFVGVDTLNDNTGLNTCILDTATEGLPTCILDTATESDSYDVMLQDNGFDSKYSKKIVSFFSQFSKWNRKSWLSVK